MLSILSVQFTLIGRNATSLMILHLIWPFRLAAKVCRCSVVHRVQNCEACVLLKHVILRMARGMRILDHLMLREEQRNVMTSVSAVQETKLAVVCKAAATPVQPPSRASLPTWHKPLHSTSILLLHFSVSANYNQPTKFQWKFPVQHRGGCAVKFQ